MPLVVLYGEGGFLPAPHKGIETDAHPAQLRIGIAAADFRNEFPGFPVRGAAGGGKQLRLLCPGKGGVCEAVAGEGGLQPLQLSLGGGLFVPDGPGIEAQGVGRGLAPLGGEVQQQGAYT